MKEYQLVIIGGGAGAFAAAIRANELETETALINAGLPIGGTCVNVGCVPSKTLLHAAEIMYHSKHHGVPGIELEVKSFDFQKVVRDEIALVEQLRHEKYEKVLNNLEHVTAIQGKAKFVSKSEVEVNGERLSADKFIIAVGSTATVPPINGIHEVGFITHIDALQLARQPQSLTVIGAGPVGLEFGQMFSRFGTKVTILQHGPTIFPRAESEFSTRLTEILSREGITVRTNVNVTNVRKEKDMKIITFEANGAREEAAAEEILLAAGKSPNTRGLNLDIVEVETDKRGAVVVNEYFQTSNPNAFAVGDVTNAPLRLETTAGREGTLAAENAIRDTKLSIEYQHVPYTIFTDPQLAGVGLTEEQQMEQVGVCACRTISFEDIPKAIIMRRTEGLIKMAIHPTTRQILGVHILSPNAGELIAQAMTLIKNGNTIDDVVNSLPMFPTLSEAIKIVALSFTKDISKLSCCI